MPADICNVKTTVMLTGLEMNRTRGTVIAYDRHINKTTHTCNPVSSYVQGICTPSRLFLYIWVR